MNYTEDIQRTIVARLRGNGLVIGGSNFPRIELAYTNDEEDECKDLDPHRVTLNLDIICEGKDIISSGVYEQLETVRTSLSTKLIGSEHNIITLGYGIVQHIEEDDETTAIFRKIVPVNFYVENI